MATEQELLDELSVSIQNTNKTNDDILLVFKNDENTDVTLRDGTVVPSVDRRIKDKIGDSLSADKIVVGDSTLNVFVEKQKVFNDGVSTQSDLLQIQNPKSGQRMFVKSTQTWFEYQPNTTLATNNVTVVNKWVMDLQQNYLASWFAKSDGTDQRQNIKAGYEFATLMQRPFIIDNTFSIGVDSTDRTGITILSNSTLAFLPQGKLVQMPTDLNSYQLVSAFGAENYKILFANIEGDKLTHTGTTGEWGHLLNVNDSKNGFIYKPRLKMGWGDGLYIGRKSASALDYDPTNILIFEPEIESCRRNGISLCSGIDVKIIRPVVKKIGDYDGVTGAYPKSCIDVEPNEYVVGYSQPCIKNCIIESPDLSQSFGGLYVSAHYDNIQFDLHISGVTRIYDTTSNTFVLWSGGSNSKGNVHIDRILCTGTPSSVGAVLGWTTDGDLKCQVDNLEIAGDWTRYSVHNDYSGGDHVTKKMGNLVIKNIKFKETTNFQFVYSLADKDYTFGYKFYKDPTVQRDFSIYSAEITSVVDAPTFDESYYLDSKTTLTTDRLYSTLKPSHIVVKMPDATVRNVAISSRDFSKRTISMDAMVENPEWGLNINGLKVVQGATTYTRMSSKTRGASITLQNNEATGLTTIFDIRGDWTFSAPLST